MRLVVLMLQELRSKATVVGEKTDGNLSIMSSNNGRWRNKTAIARLTLPSVGYNIFGISARCVVLPHSQLGTVDWAPLSWLLSGSHEAIT